MTRGSTPKHRFTIPITRENVAQLSIAYAQDGELVLRKTEKDGNWEGDTFVVKLTQEETLEFKDTEMVELQMKVLTTGGDLIPSKIKKVHVSRILDEEVLA